MAEELTPKLPPVAAPDNALIGDEAVYGETHDVEADVHEDTVKPNYAPEATQQVEYPVYEVHVALDRVITDPTSPEAVQVPDAGRGSLELPMHAVGGERVEDVFAREASEVDESTSTAPQDDKDAGLAGENKS